MQTDPQTLASRLNAPTSERQAAQTKHNTLLRYLPRLVENLEYSPQQFYATLIANLHARKIPELEEEPVTIHQAGIFSPRRLYLQIRRERLVFEICAAPFGTGFFFSERLYDRRRDARWYHYVILGGLLACTGFLIVRSYGPLKTTLMLSGIILSLWFLMRLSLISSMRFLQDQFFDTPLLGPIYQSLFHPDTYYRQDSNACYAQAVHAAVNQTISDILQATGVHRADSPESEPFAANLTEE